MENMDYSRVCSVEFFLKGLGRENFIHLHRLLLKLIMTKAKFIVIPSLPACSHVFHETVRLIAMQQPPMEGALNHGNRKINIARWRRITRSYMKKNILTASEKDGGDRHNNSANNANNDEEESTAKNVESEEEKTKQNTEDDKDLTFDGYSGWCHLSLSGMTAWEK